MSRCLAGFAVALMLLKMVTWLAAVRFEAPSALNVAYVLTTVLMVWSYVLAVSVMPASQPPVDHRVRAARVEEGHGNNVGSDDATLLDTSDDDNDSEQAARRYCERCDMHKTTRVHHCSTCHRCVYRLDHHCPWTNNCVGWNNKKFFLLFLLYTALSCLLFSAMASRLVWRDSAKAAPPLADDTVSLLQLTWALALLVGSILAGYLLFHIWLLYRGLTTFEFLVGQRGELVHTPLLYNARVYFGTNVALWWLPVAPALDTSMGGKPR